MPGTPPRVSPAGAGRKWRYVAPNAVTAASLLVGLLAIEAAVDHEFMRSAWLVVLCVLLDKLDGTLARLLDASSEFGMELDSLVDFVVFGVAPGFLVLSFVESNPQGIFDTWSAGSGYWALRGLVGLFVVCTGLRLAKFNVISELTEGDGPKCFFGIPTTLAGGSLSLLLAVGITHELEPILRALPIVAGALALLMVSNLPFPKLVPLQNRWAQGFQLINIVGAYVCGLSRIYPEYLLSLIVFYCAVGLAWGLMHREAIARKRHATA